jgi:ubiquinone/menaquinone biosynthesis C-methylase UbiE
MIERSQESAHRSGLKEHLEFRVADVQELPFEDELFDLVISESVTAFPEDKQKAVNEYVRVIKTGGSVGLNESTWLRVPPPQEMIDWVSQDVGATVNPLTKEEWMALLENAGLSEIVARIYNVDVKDETKKMVVRYGMGGLLRQTFRALQLYIRNPNYREFLSSVRASGIVPKNLNDYFGYGIFIGKKT